jgi:hypothetical protein
MLFFILLMPQIARASFVDLNFGAGLMNQAIGRYQTDVSGEKSSFNNRLALETGLTYEWNPSWHLFMDLGFLWPGGSEESYISKQVYYLNGHFGYKLTDEIILRYGGGLYLTQISGDGGEASIRNGTGFTNFPIPEETTTARNVTFNLAGEYYLHKEYSTKLEAFIFNPTNSRNRTYNLALTLRYHFGDSLWAD